MIRTIGRGAALVLAALLGISLLYLWGAMVYWWLGLSAGVKGASIVGALVLLYFYGEE